MMKLISRYGVFVILAAAVFGFGLLANLLQDQTEEGKIKRENLKQELPPGARNNVKTATLNPGRIVQLFTNKGLIEFVLFEKDCPKTTKRIVGLVQDGSYDGVKFGRVEKNFLIQTDPVKKKVKGMPCEVLKGMTHAKGSVGMAHVGRDYNSNTSVFYILVEPSPNLDSEYTNFGRLIRGMDVALKIKVGDAIKTAKIRPLTEEDRKLFFDKLKIESDRKTK